VRIMLILALVSASLTTSAFAGQLEYDLKVEGMKCAFCAYSVSKQLESLDGVVAGSVNVDLEHGRVTLRSDQAVLLRVTMNSDRLSAGDFDAVLEALGAIAVDRAGQLQHRYCDSHRLRARRAIVFL